MGAASLATRVLRVRRRPRHAVQFFVVSARSSPSSANNRLVLRPVQRKYLYAFSTASSNATLPVALECAPDVLKIPPEDRALVLTVGASANQNGTAV
jgi:Na+/H+-dicarboxylate symporter